MAKGSKIHPVAAGELASESQNVEPPPAKNENPVHPYTPVEEPGRSSPPDRIIGFAPFLPLPASRNSVSQAEDALDLEAEPMREPVKPGHHGDPGEIADFIPLPSRSTQFYGAIQTLEDFVTEIMTKLGRRPTVDEICKQLGVNSKQAFALLVLTFRDDAGVAPTEPATDLTNIAEMRDPQKMRDEREQHQKPKTKAKGGDSSPLERFGIETKAAAPVIIDALWRISL